MVDANVTNERVSRDGGRLGGAPLVRGTGFARDGENRRSRRNEEIDFIKG